MNFEIDLMHELAWLWPVAGTFTACPLRGVLWCAALDRHPLASDDLDLAIRFLDAIQQLDHELSGSRTGSSSWN